MPKASAFVYQPNNEWLKVKTLTFEVNVVIKISIEAVVINAVKRYSSNRCLLQTKSIWT